MFFFLARIYQFYYFGGKWYFYEWHGVVKTYINFTVVWRFQSKDSVKGQKYIYIYAQTFKQIPVMFKLCIIKARSTWVCWRTGIWRFQCAFISNGGQCTYRKTDVLFSLFRINIGQGRIYFISCLHKYGYDMTVQPAV